MSQPLEVEQKFRVATHEKLPSKLLAIGATELPEVRHCDTYLQHPSRDFGTSGEALRVREVDEEAVVTYKGPRHPGTVKIRTEIELPLAAGTREAWMDIWWSLGFKVVAQVRKGRRPFEVCFDGQNLQVTLDDVERLGKFVEVEGMVEDPLNVERVQQAVLALASHLGLVEVEPRSYLRQILEISETNNTLLFRSEL
jgi:adenylate cyclase, class 2